MWKDWFFYSRRERNGIIVLLIILVLLLAARIFMPSLVRHDPYDYSWYQAKIDSFKQALYLDSVRQIRLREDCFNADSLFTFDPNIADSLTMRRLGFGSVSINNITRYRNSGGSFKKAADLVRIYSVSDSELVVLSPYIRINAKEKKIPVKEKSVAQRNIKDVKRIKKKSKVRQPEFIIELNSADTALLKLLPGIGEVLSERIVKYRNWLGGFYSQDQLREVYGLKPEVIESISDLISIDTLLIDKMNINTVTVNQIKGHPYLNFYQAKAIYDYRRNVKTVQHFSEIWHIDGIDTSNFYRVKPYFSFSETGTKE